MSGKFKNLIPENCALPNAKTVGIYDSNNIKQGSIKIPSHMLYPSEEKLYSFCVLSDIHLTYDTANEDFQRALMFAEENCDFTCIAGDLTNTGADENQLALFKSIVDTYSPSKPVYAIAGNHEHYSTHSNSYWEKYVGRPLYYSLEVGDDVFIMVGHYGGYHGDGIGWLSSEMLSAEEIQWLYETLETYRNKRCFIFHHVLPHEHGVGNPGSVYDRALLWHIQDGGIGQAFMSLLKHYKNTILFHGHSHTRFWLQELDEKANYSNANGYRSIHIPSLAVPREMVQNNLTEIYAESEGYIVDVFENCIVLRGRDFIDNENNGVWLPIATYKIDTTLVEISAGTYVDETGTITI